MKIKRRFRPSFDTLEIRLALAVSITQGDFDNNGTQDIRIIGDAAGQNVIIDDNAASITLSLDANGDGDFTDVGDRNGEVINQIFETFDIQLLEGNDNFTFNVPTTDYNGAVKSLLVDLGKQGDTFFFDASNGRNIINSSVTIEVVGGGGGDEAIASFDFISGSAVSVNFDLLGGADRGSVNLTGDVVAGSVMDVHVDLGTKSNTFTFQPGDSSNPTINNSTVGMDLVAGSVSTETDTVNFFSSIKLVNNASLFVKADLGGGNDTFTGNLDLLGLDIDATSQMRFDLNGDEGNDNLQLLSAGVFGNADTDVFGLLEINVNGGAGAELITVSLGRTNNSSNLELDGTLRARLSGGSEDDQVNFRFGTDPTTDGTLDVVMLGNAGNDQLAYILRDEGNTEFGPAGFALVDGGLGTDQTFATTNGAAFDPASLHLRNAADPSGSNPGVASGDFDGNGILDLRIRGTDGVQNLTLIEDPAAGTIDVELDLNGDGDVTDSGDVDQTFNGPFETVYVQMLGGNDTVGDFSNSSYDGVARSLLVDLGKQADTFTFSPGGATSLTNSAFTLEVLAGGGRDTIQATLFNIVDDSVLGVDLDLGGGNDTATIFENTVRNASVVDIQASLGAGNNTLDMTVFDDLHTKGPTVQLNVLGGNVPTEFDTVNVKFQNGDTAASNIALFNGARFFVDASLQAGNDVFLAEYDLFRIDIDAASASRFSVNGGDGDDFIQAVRTATPGDPGTDIAGLWSFDFSGGLGADRLDLKFAEGSPTEAIELDGTLRYRAHGGGDNDALLFFLGTDATSTGAIDLSLLGGAANDTLTYSFFDGGNETFPPAGFMLLDGGLGTDTVIVTGFGAGFDAASVKERNWES